MAVERIIEIIIVALGVVVWGFTMFIMNQANNRLNDHGRRIGSLESGLNGNKQSDDLRQEFLKEKLNALDSGLKSQGDEIKELDRKVTEFLIVNAKEFSQFAKSLIDRMSGGISK